MAAGIPLGFGRIARNKHAVRRVSVCPSGRAGALVQLVHRGGRRSMWLGSNAPLNRCNATPRAALSLCGQNTPPGIKHAVRRASACPFGRAGALVKVVPNGERGCVSLA